MSMQQLQVRQTPAPSSTQVGARLQRKCACDASPAVNEECADCHKRGGGTVQRAAVNHDHVSKVQAIVNDGLLSSGRPLDLSTRSLMEQRFGHDFNQVRIHADGRAAESARAVGALAYTVGREVLFGAGRYAPETIEGKRLLAHELAHVVQQESGHVACQDASAGVLGSDIFEQAADRAAESVIDGTVVPAQIAAPIGVQRDTSPAAEAQSCGTTEFFTELGMPLLMPNVYLRGDKVLEKDTWKAALKDASKGKCEAQGKFEDVKWGPWDLGNPALGTYWTMNLNKNDITFDVNLHVVHSGKTCCPKFTGTVSWSLDVAIKRTKDGKIETGKTKTPLTGKKASKKSAGKQCCSVGTQTLVIKVETLTKDEEVAITFTGTVTIEGAVFSG